MKVYVFRWKHTGKPNKRGTYNSDNGSVRSLRLEECCVPTREVCEKVRSQPTVPGHHRRLCDQTSTSLRFATSATAARNTKIAGRVLKTGKSST